MTDVALTVVYYSGFKGATEALARAVVRGAASVQGVDARAVHVEDLDRDETLWGRLHASDAIVFGSPTYIGAVAARFKLFIEALAGEVWVDRMWLNKVAGGFTSSAGRSGDKLNCLQDMASVAAQMGMIWVPVRITGGNYSSEGSEADLNRMAGYLGVMAQANIDEPADVAPPSSDIETAEMHGAHIAQVALQLKAGRALHPAPYAPPPPPAARLPRRPRTLTDVDKGPAPATPRPSRPIRSPSRSDRRSPAGSAPWPRTAPPCSPPAPRSSPPAAPPNTPRRAS